jgi:hypothetical protein
MSESEIAPTSGTPDEWPEEPGMGRAIVLGCVVGATLSFVGVTLGMLAIGIGLDSALGLGAFVAFWGGLGFGSMVGGVLWATKAERIAGHASRAPGGARAE